MFKALSLHTGLHLGWRRTVLALALGACTSLASAASVFQVEIDTSSLLAANGNTGWIDLQFNPGNAGTPYAQALLTDFTGFGDAATAQTAGSVSGSLAGGYVIGNDAADGYNDLFHAVNFGGKVGFTVRFSGDIDPAASALGSAFGVSLYNNNLAALGTSDPAGQLVWLNWTSVGNATVMPLDNQIGVGVSAVPEAHTWLMLGAGLALVGGLARRRRPAA
ncbi:MAG: NF038129 family PEP-CTERM protein [Duganella sp.]